MCRIKKILKKLTRGRKRNNNTPVQNNLGNQGDAVSIASSVETELGLIGFAAPFVSNTTRKNSVAEPGNHRDITLEQVLLPDDHVAYQEQAKARIGDKVTQWETEDQLTDIEAGQVRDMLTGENNSAMLFGMLDTEGFIDTMRAYLIFKENNPTGYSVPENIVNGHANELAAILLDGAKVFETANVGAILLLLTQLQEGIAAIPPPNSLRWGTAISTELRRLHAKITAQGEEGEEGEEGEVAEDDAIALEKLLANWPPSFDPRLLEFKSRVGTKFLEPSKGMELFDMPLKDVALRNDCAAELRQLNQALTHGHRPSMFNGVNVVLRPEEVNTMVTAVKRFNDTLNIDENRATYVRYIKGINVFADVFFGFTAAGKKMTRQELSTQLKATNFLTAVTTLRTLLEELNSQQFVLDSLIAVLGEVATPLSDTAYHSRLKKRYNKIVNAIKASPATLCPALLVYEQAKKASANSKTSPWYRTDLFESSKGLAEGCAYLFKEVNEYHTYFNQLNNFLLSLVTVEGPETAAALEERKNMLKRIGVEGIEGSVKPIIDWQKDGGASAAIGKVEQALKDLKEGTKFEGRLLLTTIDALASFRGAFDPLSKRNFVKDSAFVGNLEVATADRDNYYDNPLNMDNSKNAGKGIAIMKGSIDTFVALKNVVEEYTKVPDLVVLEQTIDLCKKWNDALVKLSFKEDSERLVAMLRILSDYPTISVSAPVRAEESLTIDALSRMAGFSMELFEKDLEQRLLKEVEQYFEEEVKRIRLTSLQKNNYALRFDTLLNRIRTDVKQLDRTQTVRIPIVNEKLGNITEESISTLLTPLVTRYQRRVRAELNWREEKSGKATNIRASDNFLAKEKMTTSKDAKKQGAAQIKHYLNDINGFADDILGSLKGMDTAIFLEKVEPSLFGEIAIADLSRLKQMKISKKYTFKNLINTKKVGALPTVLGAMRMTAQVADSVDIIAASFIHAARELTGIIPDKDRKVERSQKNIKELKTIAQLILTAGVTTTAVAAAFVGPFAPVPLLIGGILTSILGVINLFTNYLISAEEMKKHLQYFIDAFANVSETLQQVRDRISTHRVDLQGWLQSILEAQTNIAKYPELT